MIILKLAIIHLCYNLKENCEEWSVKLLMFRLNSEDGVLILTCILHKYCYVAFLIAKMSCFPQENQVYGHISKC